MKCCGGTKALSMSTSATTIFFDSFLNPSRAVTAISTTSRLKGGYLPRPGVAFAAAETISTSTRWTYPKQRREGSFASSRTPFIKDVNPFSGEMR
nr:hypothetical protein Iba_chr08cCG1810 [Ipomoea batatas]